MSGLQPCTTFGATLTHSQVKAYRKGPAGGDGMTSPRGCRGAGPPLPPPGRGRLALASAFPPFLGDSWHREGRSRGTRCTAAQEGGSGSLPG